MNSLTPYLVLAAIFVIGIVITAVGGILRLFGLAFATLSFILLMVMFIFIPPDE